jgi:ParB family chromosome partitioning protein
VETRFPLHKEKKVSKKSRLETMTAELVIPEDSLPTTPFPIAAKPVVETRFPPTGVPIAAPKTGPGQMLAFRGHMNAAENEVKILREKLTQFADSMPAKKIDCSHIKLSRWANRHTASFLTASFLRLKDDIEKACGNVQAIMVNPIEDEPGNFRIVFGHRRYNACKQLGLPVLAVVYEGMLPDKELFSSMDRENREREDLSVYEQGRMYRMALDEGLFSSARKLAEELGVSHTWVNKSLCVADLPMPIVDCFRSPLEVQFKHAIAVIEALKTDSRGILKRAEKLRGQNLSAGVLVQELLGPKAAEGHGAILPMQVAGKSIGTLEQNKKAIVIKLDASKVNQEKVKGLQKLIQDYLTI